MRLADRSRTKEAAVKENVGTTDRIIRSIAGPALVLAGYLRLGGKAGDPTGLAVMIAGVLLIESAITRVCPVSAAAGIDTR